LFFLITSLKVKNIMSYLNINSYNLITMKLKLISLFIIIVHITTFKINTPNEHPTF
jgi:hypothetical protein